jgi:gamma-glutamyltranspeptidase/glutathione hydrolase
MTPTLLRFLALALLTHTAIEAQGPPPWMFPPVRGTREMVGAASNLQVEAGMRLLVQGGNAVDAGVATVLACAVTQQPRFSLGGEAPILIKLAGKPVVSITGIGVAPAKATIDFFLNRKLEQWERTGVAPIPGNGLIAAPVPGVFDGLIIALDRYGTKTFAEVAAPAIELAAGFPLEEEFSEFLHNNFKLMSQWPTSKDFFYPAGAPGKPGDLLPLPTLTRTLQALADAERNASGSRSEKLRAVRDLFYRGDIAKRFAAFSESHGGLITYEDMSRFHAEVDEPRKVDYRGYEVYKSGFWSQGPVMLQALTILEGYDLKAMKHNSPQYVHTVVEALKLAFADRDRYYADPKFVKVPEARLLSKEYAGERRGQIDPKQASLEHRPGAFEPAVPMPPGRPGRPVIANDTTCVNVVDRWRNVFSSTPSGAWIPSVIAGDTGLAFGTRLQSLFVTRGHPNQIEPGKRPRITLSPTIVLKGGEPYIALSTPGGDNQDQALLQALLNIVEFGMTPQQAVEAPRFQSEHLYNSFGHHDFHPGLLKLEDRFPRETANRLAALGHRVQVLGPWSNFASPTVILISGGVLHGGADPREHRFIHGR